MMSATDSGVEPSPVQNVSAAYSRISRQYQQILDRWTPYTMYRWVGTAGVLSVFFLRIVFSQGVRIPIFLIHSMALTLLISGISVS